MFVYLSKKIAIPNNVKLNCIAWNKAENGGYIAVAGSDGLLKVLKLEQGGLAAVSNLSMNQTLDGHKESVKVVTWNEAQLRLTSSDMDGVIMVWMLYKGSWYEEMTNDRKKSTVTGMSWTTDGSKICIVYEDGAVIVGSVDGNRIWGKELKNTQLTGVQWNSDGRFILFSLGSGECHLYDNQGLFLMKLNIQCLTLGAHRTYRVAALRWFNSRVVENRPVLAICYEVGKVQIMTNENDDNPVMFDTAMHNVDAEWSHDGSVLAVCGVLIDVTKTKEGNQVCFFSAYGQLLRILKVPGNDIASLSWERKSLRIAMAVDSFIYFANVRPVSWPWCYFEKTVVFLKNNNFRESVPNVLTFWNTNINQSYLKEVELTISMIASKEHCVIGVECTNMRGKELPPPDAKKIDDKNYQLLLCNSIGTTVDSKFTTLRPDFIGINSTHVVAASPHEILVWQYHTAKSSTTLLGVKEKTYHRERRYHIDAMPQSGDPPKDSGVPNEGRKTNDPICSIAVSEKTLLIARNSCVILEYSLPTIGLINTHRMSARAHKMFINCNSSRAAVIDQDGVMTIIELHDNHETQLNFSRLERKDVWAVCWASDNPLLLALMEKTRMYVFRGNDPEEPIVCAGYICSFEDLEITSVLLDDIINGEEAQHPLTHIVQLRCKSLRDTDDLLQHVGLEDSKQFIEENPHPRLWRLLAESALKKQDFDIAENAFVRCANYPGIQLIKRLKNISSKQLRNAEICAYYGEFEEAEKLYIEADRRDLAINLRITLCDWFRVVQLYRMGAGTGVSDQQMEMAWREIGHHYANLHCWETAKEYYEKAHHIEGLMDALYNLEHFDELEKCISKLPEKSPLLVKIANMLASVGMCSEAVEAYMRLGDHKSAINICVNLRQWGLAVQLAEKYHMPQVDTLLGQHAAELLSAGRLPEAVELQKKAGRYLEAARILVQLAKQEIQKSSCTLLRIKQLFVLAGLLAEQHLQKVNLSDQTIRGNYLTLYEFMNPEDANCIEEIWHSAEAYHFLMMAQRQLRFGIVHSAVITALRLREYENVLNVEDIYCLLALASCADRSFGTCSKAFIKLESLEDIPEKSQRDYEELAVKIFENNEPVDNKFSMVPCYSCEEPMPDCSLACSNCGTRYPPCIVSGAPILNPTKNVWICKTCHHCAMMIEITRHRACPLCHSLIDPINRHNVNLD